MSGQRLGQHQISIHAPAKGATFIIIIRVILLFNFNPRSREGSDTFGWLRPVFQLISIHAPAKGATRSASSYSPSLFNFNPRSREGSDMALIYGLNRVIMISIHAPAKGATIFPLSGARYIKFQSTLPRRERRLCALNHSARSKFQSTLPRRERLMFFWAFFAVFAISIHAPAKGATYHWFCNCSSTTDFNPRSREGSDQIRP